jgi:Zn-dependent peptidase ImmA (M78 family)
MKEFMCFGDPGRFEIAARWLEDHEPRERLPCEHGWSLGEIRIIIGGHVLTRHRLHNEQKEAIGWYLAPIMAWLIDQWPWLLHEESFAWPDRSGESAAVATSSALSQYIASDDEIEQEHYRKTHDWWSRHALRAADPSALYPDVYFRRVEDDIEISWLERQPQFSPKDFSLDLTPGAALLPVAFVAQTLWSFIEWGLEHSKPITQSDRDEVGALRMKMQSLKTRQTSELEALHIADAGLRKIMAKVRVQTGWESNAKSSQDVPVVTELDSAVLMFGGLNVSIGESDAETLLRFLARHRGSEPRNDLGRLVQSQGLTNVTKPYIQGYELALDAREALGIGYKQLYVDVESIVLRLGITVLRQALETGGVRGVAVAGEGFLPAILINTSSVYNDTKQGERFTLAHELCHILYDRTRARRLSHISGPWAAAPVEKRANAFAAMFLAATPALRNVWRIGNSMVDKESLGKLSDNVGVSRRALLGHLYNLDLISEEEKLRLGSDLKFH